PVSPRWETSRTVQFATPPLQLQQHPQQAQHPPQPQQSQQAQQSEQPQPEHTQLETLCELPFSRPAISAQRESWRVSESGELPADVSGHVILCGSMNPRGIRHFLESIRRIDTGEGSPEGPPVVLLIENTPRPEAMVWGEVFAFSDVYFVEGIPLRRHCLLRAGRPGGLERHLRVQDGAGRVAARTNSRRAPRRKQRRVRLPARPGLARRRAENPPRHWRLHPQRRAALGILPVEAQSEEAPRERRGAQEGRENRRIGKLWDRALPALPCDAYPAPDGIPEFDRYFASGQVYVSSFMVGLPPLPGLCPPLRPRGVAVAGAKSGAGADTPPAREPAVHRPSAVLLRAERGARGAVPARRGGDRSPARVRPRLASFPKLVLTGRVPPDVGAPEHLGAEAELVESRRGELVVRPLREDGVVSLRLHQLPGFRQGVPRGHGVFVEDAVRAVRDA
ncbi:MAG: hypothetical protein BJ554DRAFT_3086, partial [Olpidium bornovanus]